MRGPRPSCACPFSSSAPAGRTCCRRSSSDSSHRCRSACSRSCCSRPKVGSAAATRSSSVCSSSRSMCQGTAASMIFVVGCYALLARGARLAAEIVTVPALVAFVWFAVWGRDVGATPSEPLTTALQKLPGAIWHGVVVAVDNATGLNGIGPILLVLLVLFLARYASAVRDALDARAGDGSRRLRFPRIRGPATHRSWSGGGHRHALRLHGPRLVAARGRCRGRCSSSGTPLQESRSSQS